MGGKKRKARAKKTSTKKRKEKRVRKRKMARVKKKKRGMTKFSFVTQPRHFVLHIPNTPPHHHLCSQKARRDRLRQFEKKKHASKNARNARPILSLHDRTSVIKNKSKMWMVFSLNDNK